MNKKGVVFLLSILISQTVFPYPSDVGGVESLNPYFLPLKWDAFKLLDMSDEDKASICRGGGLVEGPAKYLNTIRVYNPDKTFGQFFVDVKDAQKKGISEEDAKAFRLYYSDERFSDLWNIYQKYPDGEANVHLSRGIRVAHAKHLYRLAQNTYDFFKDGSPERKKRYCKLLRDFEAGLTEAALKAVAENTVGGGNIQDLEIVKNMLAEAGRSSGSASPVRPRPSDVGGVELLNPYFLPLKWDAFKLLDMSDEDKASICRGGSLVEGPAKYLNTIRVYNPDKTFGQFFVDVKDTQKKGISEEDAKAFGLYYSDERFSDLWNIYQKYPDGEANVHLSRGIRVAHAKHLYRLAQNTYDFFKNGNPESKKRYCKLLSSFEAGSTEAALKAEAESTVDGENIQDLEIVKNMLAEAGRSSGSAFPVRPRPLALHGFLARFQERFVALSAEYEGLKRQAEALGIKV